MAEFLQRLDPGGKPIWGAGGGGGVTLVMPAEYTVTPVGTLITVDWNGRVLLDDLGNPSVNFGGDNVLTFGRYLLFSQDNGGGVSLAWNDGQLKSVDGTVSLGWIDRYLRNDAGLNCLDWSLGDPTNIPDAGPGTEITTINAILAKLATYGMN